MNIKDIPYKTNYITFDLDSNLKRIGKVKLDSNTIESVSTILCDYFIDYFKKGGDIDNLTPDNLFNVINKNS